MRALLSPAAVKRCLLHVPGIFVLLVNLLVALLLIEHTATAAHTALCVCPPAPAEDSLAWLEQNGRTALPGAVFRGRGTWGIGEGLSIALPADADQRVSAPCHPASAASQGRAPALCLLLVMHRCGPQGLPQPAFCRSFQPIVLASQTCFPPCPCRLPTWWPQCQRQCRQGTL